MDFNSISLGANEPNSCTPDLPEGFVGVRINMPQNVDLEKDKFAVCGTYRFVPEYVYSFDYIHHAIVLVVVDATFHQPRASNLKPPVTSFSRPGQSEAYSTHCWL